MTISGLRRGDAAAAGTQPDEKQERALGIGAGVFGYEEAVHPLAWQAENTCEPRLVAMAREMFLAGAGEFIPQRRGRPGPKRRESPARFGRAGDLPGGAAAEARRRLDSPHQRVEIAQAGMNVNAFHPASL